MTATYCLGGRHYSNTINQNVIEKVNPKTKKLSKLLEVNVRYVEGINHKFSLNEFIKIKI